MSRLNIDIDENKMNQSKNRTIQKVMTNIDAQTVHQTSKRKFSLSKESIVFAFMLVIALVVMISIPDSQITVQIQAYESEQIANTSYLSASMISMSTTVNELSVSTSIMEMSLFQQLGSTDFEEDIDEFNQYFDMLRVYIDQVDLQDIMTFEELIDSDFDYMLVYELDNQQHTFYLNQNGTTLSGEMHVGTTIYVIEGTLEDNEGEFGLTIAAYNGEDYVMVTYVNETGSETNKKYHIEQKVGNVITQKEIEVVIEDNETVVKIKEEDKEYEISKEVLVDRIIYEVEYNVNGQEGEVEIEITFDELGNEIFHYEISEDGEEVELDLEDPDEEDEEDEEDEPEDEESEEEL